MRVPRCMFTDRPGRVSEHPIAWELEARGETEDDDAEDDEEDEDKAEAPKPRSEKPQVPEHKVLRSHAYDEFRQFLELGCMGSPVQAYPAVIVVLSTIPPSVSPSASYPQTEPYPELPGPVFSPYPRADAVHFVLGGRRRSGSQRAGSCDGISCVLVVALGVRLICGSPLARRARQGFAVRRPARRASGRPRAGARSIQAWLGGNIFRTTKAGRARCCPFVVQDFDLLATD